MSRKNFSEMADRDGAAFDERTQTNPGGGKGRRRFRRCMAACLCTVVVIAAVALALPLPAFGDCGAQSGSWFFRKRPGAANIPGHVSSVEVGYCHGGKSVTWDVRGEKLDALRAWLAGLRFHFVSFAEGEAPGDSDGGAFYDFTTTEGDDSFFCYVMNGKNQNYLLVEGEWYHVDNPSPPPVK